jgi:hypothetical protein
VEFQKYLLVPDYHIWETMGQKYLDCADREQKSVNSKNNSRLPVVRTDTALHLSLLELVFYYHDQLTKFFLLYNFPHIFSDFLRLVASVPVGGSESKFDSIPSERGKTMYRNGRVK